MTNDRSRLVALWDRRSEPHAAVELMRLEAEYHRAGEPLPPLLALWRCEVNEPVFSVEEPDDGTPIEQRWAYVMAKAIGFVRVSHRPPKFVSERDLLRTVATWGDHFSERALAIKLAQAYGIGRTTAWKHVERAKRRVREGKRQLAGLAAVRSRGVGSAE